MTSLVNVVTSVRHIQPYLGPCQLANPIIVPRQEAYLQAIGLVGDSPWRTGQRWAPCSLSFDFNESLNSWKEILDWPCGPNLDVVDLKNAGAMGMTAVDR